MTATAANGLALMWEMLYIAASLRLPIVMMVTNRALSGNINIHCDHSDTMGARDAGWIQLFSENAQEAYDNIIQAVRIAEDLNVRLPVMVTQDGFIISHAVERVEVLDDELVQNFVGPYKPVYPLLDLAHPVTYGPLDLFDYYFEHKRSQIEAIDNSFPIIKKVGEEFGKMTGRAYDLLETYKLEGAEYAVVALGSTCGTAKEAVNVLRERGKKSWTPQNTVFPSLPQERDRRSASAPEGRSGTGSLGLFRRFWGPGVYRNSFCAL